MKKAVASTITSEEALDTSLVAAQAMENVCCVFFFRNQNLLYKQMI